MKNYDHLLAKYDAKDLVELMDKLIEENIIRTRYIQVLEERQWHTEQAVFTLDEKENGVRVKALKALSDEQLAKYVEKRSAEVSDGQVIHELTNIARKVQHTMIDLTKENVVLRAKMGEINGH